MGVDSSFRITHSTGKNAKGMIAAKNNASHLITDHSFWLHTRRESTIYTMNNTPWVIPSTNTKSRLMIPIVTLKMTKYDRPSAQLMIRNSFVIHTTINYCLIETGSVPDAYNSSIVFYSCRCASMVFALCHFIYNRLNQSLLSSIL